MTTITATQSTLISALWPQSNKYAVLRPVLLVLLGTLALTVSAKIQVPFWPVPLTMQTFVTLVLGMAFGWRLAGATVLLYLIEGAVGLPVFAGTPAKGIGLAYMMGPTGGFLVGFALAAMVVGWLAERGWDRNIVSTAGAMLIGNVVIYVPGLIWLSSLIGVEKAIQFGLLPFLAGDALKLVLAAALMPLAWQFLVKRRGN
jgi:biotin transport system substrate-specific component